MRGRRQDLLDTLAGLAQDLLQETLQDVVQAVPEEAVEPLLGALGGRTSDRDRALQVLGLPAGTYPTPVEVKRAWRTASRTAHPDRGGAPGAQATVNWAREVLLDS